MRCPRPGAWTIAAGSLVRITRAMDRGPTCHFGRVLELCFCLPNRRIQSGGRSRSAEENLIPLLLDRRIRPAPNETLSAVSDHLPRRNLWVVVDVRLSPFARRWHRKERKNDQDMQTLLCHRRLRHPVATVSRGSGALIRVRASIQFAKHASPRMTVADTTDRQTGHTAQIGEKGYMTTARFACPKSSSASTAPPLVC